MKRRAMSLVEVMIAAGILSLLLTMAFWVIVPAMKMVQEGSVKTDLEEQGMVAIQQLFSELQKTTPTGTSIRLPLNPATDSMILATNPIVSLDPSGFPVFDSKLEVFYNLPDKKRLYRKRYPPAPPAVLIPFRTAAGAQASTSALDQIILSANGTERSLALNVEAFRVEKVPTTGGEVYTTHLQMKQTLQDKTVDVDLYRKLFLRNHP